MARGESLDVITDRVEALQLGSKVHGVGGFARPAHVECGDTDGIAGSEKSVVLLVMKNPREHTVEVSGRIDAMFEVQRDDDLAVRVCLELVRCLEALAEDTVVVDLAVDGQRDGSLLVDERLSARVCPA